LSARPNPQTTSLQPGAPGAWHIKGFAPSPVLLAFAGHVGWNLPVILNWISRSFSVGLSHLFIIPVFVIVGLLLFYRFETRKL
jgi:hypothetical protein